MAGLARTAFPKRACCRGHIVIATAKLGAPALTGLILLGLGLMGLGDLGKKLGIGLAFAGDAGLPGGGGQEEGETELGAHRA